MKKIIPLCLITLLAACSTTPKAPESQPAAVEQPAASTPAASTPSAEAAKPADSVLVSLGKQLAQACSGGSKQLCSASDQVAALLNQTDAPNASAPSFNCAKAGSDVEKAICSSKPLATLDAILAKQYKTASSNPTVKADQKAWLSARNACQDVECVATKYAERLLQLNAR